MRETKLAGMTRQDVKETKLAGMTRQDVKEIVL